MPLLSDGIGRRLLEAAAKRTLGVNLAEEQNLRGKLVEAVTDLRLADRINRRMGFMLLNAAHRLGEGQDAPAEDRMSVADRVRSITRVDSHMLYAARLRNAFCWGRGVTTPKATDEEVQVLLDDLWDAPANRAEITSPEAQWRAGKDLWEVADVYHVVFADGLDGRVLLGGLQHGQVRGVVRDPKVWRRVLYYVVTEYVYDWDYEKHAPKPNPQQRIVYYEAFDGWTELEEELQQGRTPPTVVANMRTNLLRPGRVMHVSINRGREQAFGDPEMRTGIKWASGFSDLMAGQTEKAKATQRWLMKLTAQGASTEQQLTDTAIRAVNRRSPLATSFDGLVDLEEEQRVGAGGSLFTNEAIKAEPFNLDSGSAGARQDLESASQAFAAATNFPGHYFFGDPGSLAGSMAVELPVLKLTDIDQEVWKAHLRKLCDLRIKRAIAVGLLSRRREPTEDELASGIELGADGMLERDLTYQLDMPEPLRRNLPELMQLVVDTATTFDPTGQSEPLQRALLGYVFGDLLEYPDTPSLVERVFAHAQEQQQQVGGGAPGSTGDPTSTGPDGLQHPTDNPYGARRQAAVVEAMVAALWERLGDPDDPLAIEMRDRLVEDASSNGDG